MLRLHVSRMSLACSTLYAGVGCLAGENVYVGRGPMHEGLYAVHGDKGVLFGRKGLRAGV